MVSDILLLVINKIIGYLLLFFGILVILLSTINLYQVFTRQQKPVQFFTSQNSTINLNALINSMAPPTNNPALKNVQATSLINESALNDGLNLTLHIVLIGVVSGAGFKLASLGVMLLRSIQVKLLENPIPVTKKVVGANQP